MNAHIAMDQSGFQKQMLADIEALAGEIGIRFAGTAGDARAAQYIAGQFARHGLAPETSRFRMMGWRLQEGARLEISALRSAPWQVKCYPYVYSSSTPPAGLTGRIVYWGRQAYGQEHKFRPFERAKFQFRKYAIVDDDDQIGAYVVSRDFPDGARTAAWGVMPLPVTTPTVMIGERDGRQLEELVSDSRRVSASLGVSTEFIPDAVTHNIIARLPGSDRRKAQQQILVAAHYDTQYTGPGAVDNASGVAAVLALARYFQEHPLHRSLLFAVYGGEEIGFLGAKHHMAGLRARGELESVAAVLNLDMLACNEPNWIHASEDFLAQETAQRAAREVGIVEKYGSLEIVTPPWPSGDQDPFYDWGIPCVSFTWKGYKYEYTHTPDDTPDKVDAGVLADSFRLACSVVANMDRML